MTGNSSLGLRLLQARQTSQILEWDHGGCLNELKGVIGAALYNVEIRICRAKARRYP